MEFKDYVEKAKENQYLKSNKDIAVMIGINNSAITDFSKYRSFPSQETVLKLAALAGIKPEQALIDFNLWKTKDKPNAHRIWQKLAKMIQTSSLILLVSCCFWASPCKASKKNLPSLNHQFSEVNIMRQNVLWLREEFRGNPLSKQWDIDFVKS